MTEDNGTWTLSGNFIAGDFGFQKLDENGNQADWLYARGGVVSISEAGNYEMIVEGTGAGANFHLDYAGKYTFSLNPETMTLTVTAERIDRPEPKVVYCVARDGYEEGQVRVYVYKVDGGEEAKWENRAYMKRVENATYDGKPVYKYTITGDYDRVIFTFRKDQTLRYPADQKPGLLIENNGTYILRDYVDDGVADWVDGYVTPEVATTVDVYSGNEDVKVENGELVSCVFNTEGNHRNGFATYVVKNSLGVEFTGTISADVVAVDAVTLHIARPLDKAYTVNFAGDHGSHSINVPAIAWAEVTDETPYIMVNEGRDITPVYTIENIPAHVIFSGIETVEIGEAARTMSLRAATLALNGKTALLNIVDSELTDDAQTIADAIKYGAVSGVADVTVDAAEAEYYNLQGIRVSAPEAGNVYIRRTGNTAVKVIL